MNKMGTVSSTPSTFIHTYVVEEFGEKRCPISEQYNMTQWDTIPDKNIQYYTGERFFVIKK
jgi:hypothetical protein